MGTPHFEALIGGRYLLSRLLGEGGMGAVYEAHDLVRGERVAVKVMHPLLADDEQAAARMVREAQTSSRVRHPNVVEVFDAGRDGDTVYLVMEYLEGESLAAVMRRAGTPLHEAIALLTEAMRGVSAAHRVGIVHRDIKPENIFLARVPGRVRPLPKVLDFGVSMLLDGSGPRLTRTDMTIGTPLYMSYEQLSGMREAVDARADVYAFGVILYELLTGRPPHVAQTVAHLGMIIATTEPLPPRRLRPEVPPALEHAVLSAIARDRDERTPSLDALVRALAPFAEPSGFARPLEVATLSLVSGMPTSLVAARGGDAGPLSALTTEQHRAETTLVGAAPTLRVERTRGRVAALIGAALGAMAAGIAVVLSRSVALDAPAAPPPLPTLLRVGIAAPDAPASSRATQVAPAIPYRWSPEGVGVSRAPLTGDASLTSTDMARVEPFGASERAK